MSRVTAHRPAHRDGIGEVMLGSATEVAWARTRPDVPRNCAPLRRLGPKPAPERIERDRRRASRKLGMSLLDRGHLVRGDLLIVDRAGIEPAREAVVATFATGHERDPNTARSQLA